MESDERKSLHLPKPIDYTKLTPYQRQQQRVALLATPKREFSATSLWSTIRKVNRYLYKSNVKNVRLFFKIFKKFRQVEGLRLLR